MDFLSECHPFINIQVKKQNIIPLTEYTLCPFPVTANILKGNHYPTVHVHEILLNKIKNLIAQLYTSSTQEPHLASDYHIWKYS